MHRGPWSMVLGPCNSFPCPSRHSVTFSSPKTLSEQPNLRSPSSSSSSYLVWRSRSLPNPSAKAEYMVCFHRPPPLSMSHPPHLRFLFSVAFSALFLPCAICDAEDPFYDFCQAHANCGDIEIRFPFGIQEGRYGCGDPEFRLFCPDGHLAQLQIGTNNYTILYPNKVGDFSNDRRIAIVNSKAKAEYDPCDPRSYSINQWNRSYFNIASQYRITTFFGDCTPSANRYLRRLNCSDDWYYSGSGASQNSNIFGCKTLVEVPVPQNFLDSGDFGLLAEGFEITWSYPNETRNRTCNGCVSSGGYCGYDISSGDFLCLCKNGQQSDKCPNDGSSKNAAVAAIGYSIAGVAVIAIVILLVFFYRRRKSANNRRLGIKAVESRTSVSKVEKFLEDLAYEMPTRYAYSQLERITNNVSFKLGEGGFGVVYRGTLSNGTLVAVKLLDLSKHGETQFMNEVGTIGRIHHVHLVRLLGFSFEGSRSALLYEYMPNGSLEKFIFPGYKDTSHTLNWERLYSIALGAARGIAYLHTDCHQRIIHLDIKPHNVLLDENFSPKVSDFGLAKLYCRGDDHISVTAARGTPGYAAPEMWSRNFGPVTDKSDVYSFGMLLLEMVGGRKNMDVRLGASNSQMYFPEWIFHHLQDGELHRLRGIWSGSVEDEGRAARMSKVGLWCIQSKPSDRPSMSRVVQMLEGNGNDISSPPSPFDRPSTAPEAPFLSASTLHRPECSSSNEIGETA